MQRDRLTYLRRGPQLIACKISCGADELLSGYMHMYVIRPNPVCSRAVGGVAAHTMNQGSSQSTVFSTNQSSDPFRNVGVLYER